jgi:hypothetical protein
MIIIIVISVTLYRFHYSLLHTIAKFTLSFSQFVVYYPPRSNWSGRFWELF